MLYPADHGLPLVQLKERRRELVAALQGRATPVKDEELNLIAVLQQAISAFEDVIADLDCEIEEKFGLADPRAPSLPAFGRRGVHHSPA